MKIRILQCLYITAICLLGACSGGGSDQAPAEQDPVENSDDSESEDENSDQTPDADENEDENTGETPDSEDPVVQKNTRVNFDIMVPAYVSKTLKVGLVWGDKDLVGVWNNDEFWTVTDEFPKNTEHLLTVKFYDRNGDITLGSFEKAFETGTNNTESYRITADQFDTNSWDSDKDGVSNIDELIAGTNPLVDERLDPVVANLEYVADKTFRIGWQQTSGVAFYRVLENPDGVSGFSLVSGDLDASTVSFDHRVALYKRANARYIVQACNVLGCVDSDELIVGGTLERSIGYFKASNAEGGLDYSGKTFRDRFGGAISLSADGTTMAIGAFGESSVATGVNGNQNDNTADEAGAVYVFERVNGSWQQQAYIKASNTSQGDQFGRAISLSADGNTLAIGAPVEQSVATGINGNQNDNSKHWSGAVYVFTRSAGSWLQQAYVKASNSNVRDEFGASVSLSSDGNILAVGAPFEASAATGINGNQADNSVIGAGAVFVFVRINETWQQQAYVKASNPDDKLVLFGDAVSLSADGKTLAIGAYGEDSRATGINGDQADNTAFQAGAVYLFVHVNGNWRQQAYLKASNTDSFNLFGVDISLSADGNTLVVGAYGEESIATGVNGNEGDNSAKNAGAAYVFVQVNGNWQQQAYIKASNAQSGDTFGSTVSLSADGNTLAIAAPGEDSVSPGINGNQFDNSAPDSGAVYLFERNNGIWLQKSYVKTSKPQQLDATGFIDASSLHARLSADGNTLAVGALRERSGATGINGNQDDRSSPLSGAVYLY